MWWSLIQSFSPSILFSFLVSIAPPLWFLHLLTRAFQDFLLLSFFVCSVVLLFSACFLWWSSIFWNFPLHFVSFFSIPSFSFTGDLNDVCLYPCTFIAEWSVFVFRVPCPSSGRSCSMSAGKLKAPQTEPAMVWHSGERYFHFMQGEEVEVPCQ